MKATHSAAVVLALVMVEVITPSGRGIAQIRDSASDIRPAPDSVLAGRLRAQTAALRSLRDRRIAQASGRFEDALRRSGVPNSALDRLRRAGIRVPERVFTNEGQLALATLRPSEASAAARVSTFSLLSDDPRFVVAIANSRFNSLPLLASASIDDLLRVLRGDADSTDLGELRTRAQALTNIGRLRDRQSRASEANPHLYRSERSLQLLNLGGGPISPIDNTVVVAAGATSPSITLAAYYPHAASASGMASFPRTPNGDLARIEEETPVACFPHTSALSPGVYLLQLLDFVSKTFAPDLNTVEKINLLFLQRFEDLPLQQGSDQEISYVELTIRVLENLIAETEGDPWPNQHMVWSWTDLHLRPSTDQAAERRESIYARFDDAIYGAEPRFSPTVLIDLFDNHVRELGTNRQDVRLARAAPIEVQTRFAHRLGLTTADLPSIDISNSSISLASIWGISGRLFEYHRRAAHNAYLEERTADLADSLRSEFGRAYRRDREVASGELLFQLVAEIDVSVSAEAYEAELELLRSAARECVQSGTLCPAGSAFVSKPMTPLRELIRIYAHIDPLRSPATDVEDFVDARLAGIEDDLAERRLDELMADEPLPNSVPAARRAELQAEANSWAAEQLNADAILDAQIDSLSRRLLAKRLTAAAYRQDFDAEVAGRATANWRSASSRAEAGLLDKIRDNLVAVAIRSMATSGNLPPTLTVAENSPVATAENTAALADLLHLDLTISERQNTTPLAFGIGRLQSFVHEVRLGTETRFDGGTLSGSTWAWLQSYGTWHAATMVSVYPESFLIPEIRRNATPEFTAVTDSFADQLPTDPEEIFAAYRERVDELRGMSIQGAIAYEQTTYVIAAANTEFHQRELYYSSLGERGEWSSWRSLGLNPDPWQPIRVGFVPPGPDHGPLVFVFSFGKEVAEERMCAGPGGTTPCPKWKFPLRYASFSITGRSLTPVSAPGWTELPDAALAGAGGLVESLLFTRYARTPSYLYPDVITIAHVVNDSYIQSYLPIEDPIAPKPEDGIGIETILVELDPGGVVGRITVDTLRSGFGNALGAPNNWAQIRGVTSDWSGSESFWSHLSGSGRLFSSGTIVPGSSGCCPANAGFRSFGTAGSSEDSRTLVWYNQPDWERVVFAERSSGGVFATARTVSYSLAGSYSSWRTGVWMDNRPLIFGQTNGLASYADASRLEGVGSLTQPLQLSVGTQPGWVADANAYEQTTASDPVRRYLDEYFLHLPTWVAQRLSEAGRHEEAFRVLSRAYDPLGGTPEERERYPAFGEASFTASTLSVWLADPFNPYAIADLYKPVYLAGIKLAQVENLLEWADQLFSQDTPETLGRARELYELANRILRAEWLLYAAEPEDDLEFVEDLAADAASSPAPDVLDLAGLTAETVEELGSLTITEAFPELPSACLPPNPLLALYQWRVAVNLEKIRRNQNIAGMERSLQLYASPVDPTRLVRQAASDGIFLEEAVPSSPPPIYRYEFLVNLARQLVTSAQQLEAAMLSSLEKAEDAEYETRRAHQDMALERGNLLLRNLQLQHAINEQSLAQAQRERAEITRDHYEELLSEGVTFLEEFALKTLLVSLALPAAVTGGSTGGSISYSPSGILQTFAGMIGTVASYDRRSQEWEHQLALAEQDVRLADFGIEIAESHTEAAEQEASIAQQRADFTRDNVEFLESRFTNAEFYNWMDRNLRRLYRQQLNLAVATAKAAQRALEFEKQQTIGIIGYDYWDPDMRGLLGAARLLQDLDALEQHRLRSNQREREIEATISLASVAPVELQQLRETGVLEFETAGSWFDAHYPGHYLRMIREVRVSMIALLPPTEGVRATLSNNGISRIVSGPPFSGEKVIYRLPEAVNLSSAIDATGLLGLAPEGELLRPFEGSGVATSWRLELPRAANRFDYSTIADVLFTVRYTALEDRAFREQVLTALGQDESGYVPTSARRGFSLRQNFPDVWYALQNEPPGSELTWTLQPDDFLPNEEGRRVSGVTVAVAWKDGYELTGTLPIELTHTSTAGASTTASLQITPERSFTATEQFNGRSPFGTLGLRLPTSEHDVIDAMDDLIIVVDYRGRAHYPR